MIIHTSPQGSTEWLIARAGLATASMFKTARERLKSGDLSAAAKNYAFRVAVERISGYPMDEGNFQTWAMKRGQELEPEARDAVSVHLGVDVNECGFVTTDCGRFGASADGLVGEDQGIEIKCLVSPERIRDALLNNDVSEFMDQVQGGMWITDRSIWHLAVYTPILSGVNRSLTVWTIQRDDTYIAKLVDDLHIFDELVSEYIARLERPI